ncbi:MAG: response regulator, partial [Bacteroidota bacterium]
MSEKSEQLILIVDDNPNNLQVLGSILSTKGYKIALAKSGTEALEFIAKEPPDLVFLDIMMPDMNGFEVCEKLKSQEETRMLPIIFVSALSNPQHKVKAFETGGVDYITKPFNMAEVVERARVQLELKSTREEYMKTNRQLLQQINAREKLEEELRKAKEIAEQTTRTKSNFLASMSHE